MTIKAFHPAADWRRRTALPRAAVVAITVALAAFGCSPKKDDAKASATPTNVTLTAQQQKNIHLYTIAPSRFHKTIETTGIVDFDNDQATSVVAPFSGPVTRLLVSPGDRVGKGAALAVVDSPDFAAAISAYRKGIVTAQTSRRLADMDKDLVAHQGVAQREAAQAETDAASAEADRSAALQTLLSLGVDAQTIKSVREGHPVSGVQSILRAPIAGTVVEKLITPGQLLQAGSTAAFTIADLSRVWVMAQAFGADADAIHDGDTATVTTGDGAGAFAGRVENIAGELDPNTRSVAVRVVADNPQGLLKKQMYVHVAIQSRQETGGLLVPVSAILRDDDNLPFVYVAQRDGSFARAHVTLGYRAGDRYDITAGLRGGERIIADGALFIQFMQNQ
ncbi:MAG TPA: efflux RND transporter periplasmic adaptor subunit [Rhizomicrobium sp.]|jgi:cobalt-zinc-cadmium efflux system membrane fusion protein|nr:efflux RND transporter periplasmic adaptor subunit [Rhizomicrobium sp.]